MGNLPRVRAQRCIVPGTNEIALSGRAHVTLRPAGSAATEQRILDEQKTDEKQAEICATEP